MEFKGLRRASMASRDETTAAAATEAPRRGELRSTSEFVPVSPAAPNAEDPCALAATGLASNAETAGTCNTASEAAKATAQ